MDSITFTTAPPEWLLSRNVHAAAKYYAEQTKTTLGAQSLAEVPAACV